MAEVSREARTSAGHAKRTPSLAVWWLGCRSSSGARPAVKSVFDYAVDIFDDDSPIQTVALHLTAGVLPIGMTSDRSQSTYRGLAFASWGVGE
jgi:hypothetical protein